MRRRTLLAAACGFAAAAVAGCVMGPVHITGPLSFIAPITGDRVEVLRAHLESEYGAEPAREQMAFAVRRNGRWIFPGDGEVLEENWSFLVNEGEEVLFWPAASEPPFDYA